MPEPPESPGRIWPKYRSDALGGDGAAAIAMGTLATAANTAVLVKGQGIKGLPSSENRRARVLRNL